MRFGSSSSSVADITVFGSVLCGGRRREESSLRGLDINYEFLRMMTFTPSTFSV